ncbi:MAG: cupredoxin domain-containing protein [Alphaproteobacteria bacterium]
MAGMKFWVVFAVLLVCAGVARADSAVVEAQLTLFNNTFDPQTLNVPAGKKIKLTVVNKDSKAAEFESSDLDREKVVPANGQIYVYIGPLDPGTYDFFDDFHHSTTTGTIIAK